MIEIDADRAERVAEEDTERIARVMALRNAIREGTYDVPAWAVASRMLEHLRWP